MLSLRGCQFFWPLLRQKSLSELFCCYISGAPVAEGQSSGTVTPADTRESSELRDTESEVSTGLSDIIGNLQSLRRDIEREDTTDTSSVEGGARGGGASVGRASETGELRQRTGKL